jgi:twitching motility two-component system response regulator PilG
VALTPESDALRNQLRRTLLARAVSIASTDRNEARMRFREVATLNPNDPRIWQALCNLAETRVEQMQCLRALIRVAPDHREGRDKLRHILVETARDLMSANSRAEARTCWREAVDITGGDVELWLGLADATSDDEEAAQALQSAYELDPRDLRTLDALQRRKGVEIDPSALPTIDDAFARFEPAANASGPTILDGESVDDSLFDALSQLPGVPQQSQAPVPELVAPQEPAAIVASMIESLDAVAADAAIVAPAPEATVTIELAAPVEVAQPAEAAPPVEVTPPVEAAPAAEAATVMVVDDSPTIRKILGLTLERAGYRVLAEANGQSALQRLEEVLPRVILLDISMPDLDGYEVCKRIKQNPRTTAVPVIMLSGKGAFFDKVKGHMAGATEYLTKPFETPAVLAVVTSHCQGTVEVSHG